MLPTIDPEEIKLFEDQFQIELPSDYKYFLTEIGAGFEKSRRFLTPNNWKESFWVHPESINPFQHTAELGLEHRHKPTWLAFVNDPIHKTNWRNGTWDPMFGTLAIEDIGCGLYYRMILNGDLKGNLFVWGDHAFNPPKFLDQVGYLNWVQLQIDIHP
ncbi:MAG: SMI1/KNR4 family protein [Bacteroidota bacterium]